MRQPISVAHSQNEAVDLDQPDHQSSILEFADDSATSHGSLSMMSRGASINEAIATPRNNETDREASDEAENLIQLEPLDGAALTSYMALGIQHNSSMNTLPVLGSSISPGGPTKPEFEHKPAARHLWRKWYESWIDSWTAEILSCSVSAATLFCLIATLRSFEGRVVTEMPLKININSLVAVLATTIKASLLLAVAEGIGQLKWLWFLRANSLSDFESFDCASRGPWGAFLLTIQLKMRHLSAFGAIITVLALAIEPFTQQIVRPVICHKSQSAMVAQVPRANNCTGLGYAYGPGQGALDTGMVAAMYTGLLNNSQSVKAQCYTGNCTFPSSSDTTDSYQTLGFSSVCVDITNEFQALPSFNQWYIPSLGNRTSRINTVAGNSTHTLVTGDQYHRQYYSEGQYDFHTFGHHWLPKQNATPLLQFVALTVAKNSTGNMNPVGAECKVWPAVHSIKAQVDLGELHEIVTSETPLQYHISQYTSSWLHVSSGVLRNGSWHDCTPSNAETIEKPVPVYNDTLWKAVYNEERPKNMQWYAEDCVWTIDHETDVALRQELNNIYSDRIVQLEVSLGRADVSRGDVWIKQIFRNGTASATTIGEQVGHLASSMTAYNRKDLRHESHSRFAYGDTIKVETCVQVQWPWISFPAGLVALASLFLALTIWSTKQISSTTSGRKVWKTSSLAVLFNGLDKGLLREQGPMDKKSEMMDSAARLQVALKREDDGWKLGPYAGH